MGESGSGKTTTGRCMLRLIEPTSGEVLFRGRNVLSFSKDELRRARRDMQIVFQDPYSSLNPRMRAKQIVEEPLSFTGWGIGRHAISVRQLSSLSVSTPLTSTASARVQAVSASASGLPVLLRSTRRSSFWTSRSPPSTCPSRHRSSTC